MPPNLNSGSNWSTADWRVSVPAADNDDGVHDARLLHGIEDPSACPFFAIVIICGDDLEITFTAQAGRTRPKGHIPPSGDFVGRRTTSMSPANVGDGVPHLRCIRRIDDVCHKRGLSVSDLLGSEGDRGDDGLGGHETVQV
jgi:hypothetical protein